ncbi:hypothetical protein [Pantoea sp. SoEX]|uniref:hypothetical protein n=1 Tax=Pantoea sp. SoEX TaxID=2576763 RepID=UPI00135A832D|nr:hypothetical protein [Pantoea sp. SoEX]
MNVFTDYSESFTDYSECFTNYSESNNHCSPYIIWSVGTLGSIRIYIGSILGSTLCISG